MHFKVRKPAELAEVLATKDWSQLWARLPAIHNTGARKLKFRSLATRHQCHHASQLWAHHPEAGKGAMAGGKQVGRRAASFAG